MSLVCYSALNQWQGRFPLADRCRLLLGTLWWLFGTLWWRSLGWRSLLGLAQTFLSGMYLLIQACPLPCLLVDIELLQLPGAEMSQEADTLSRLKEPAAPAA